MYSKTENASGNSSNSNLDTMNTVHDAHMVALSEVSIDDAKKKLGITREISGKEREEMLRKQDDKFRPIFKARFEVEKKVYKCLKKIFRNDAPKEILDLMSGYANAILGLLKDQVITKQAYLVDGEEKPARKKTIATLELECKVKEGLMFIDANSDPKALPRSKIVTLLSSGLVFPENLKELCKGDSSPFGHLRDEQAHLRDLIKCLQTQEREVIVVDGIDCLSTMSTVVSVSRNYVKDVLREGDGNWEIEQWEEYEDSGLIVGKLVHS